MAKRRGAPKKDKFDALSDEFKTAIQQSSPEEIKKRVSEIALLECEMRNTLKIDPEVKSKKEELGNLMSPYREDLKSYKLQIDYANTALKDKGAT